MASDPDLPILLRSLRVKTRKIEALEEQLKSERYVKIPKPSLRASLKEVEEWEYKYRRANPIRYKLERSRIEMYCRLAERRAKIVQKLRAIFAEFQCVVFDWEALALALMEAPVYRASGPVPAHKLKQVNDRTHEDWRRLALELTLANSLFSVEPPEIHASSRKADRDIYTALRMDALLTQDPETRQAFSPSASHAARIVFSNLLDMEKNGRSGPEGLKDHESLRTRYHGMVKDAKNAKEIREIRFSESMQRLLYSNTALVDLIRVTEHW